MSIFDKIIDFLVRSLIGCETFSSVYESNVSRGMGGLISAPIALSRRAWHGVGAKIKTPRARQAMSHAVHNLTRHIHASAHQPPHLLN